MNHSRYLQLVLIFSLAILTPVAVVNYLMDPLWTFAHSLPCNNLQYGVNERQQKTNKFYFEPKKYDALILGSSRTTCINQHDFPDMKAFNFAVSAALPSEYPQILQFAKKHNGKDFDVVFIGLDFRDSNARQPQREDMNAVIRQTTSFLYRYRLLLSCDTLKLSLVNLKRYLTTQTSRRSYTRDNRVLIDKLKPEAVDRLVKSRRQGFADYAYNDNLPHIYQRLQAENPHTRFVVFTTPVTSHLFELYLQEGRWPDYQRWLHEIVASFGQVYHFMDLNSITRNYPEHFRDSNHFYPHVARYITRRLISDEAADIPPDFGARLHALNLNEYLASLNYHTEHIQTASLAPASH